MASYTPNYNLKKPADADTYDIADANGNMDLIDAALHSQNEAISNLTKTVSSGSLHDLAGQNGLFWLTSAVTDKPESGGGLLILRSYSNAYCVGEYINPDNGTIYSIALTNNTWTYKGFVRYGDAALKGVYTSGSFLDIAVNPGIYYFGGNVTGKPSNDGGVAIVGSLNRSTLSGVYVEQYSDKIYKFRIASGQMTVNELAVVSNRTTELTPVTNIISRKLIVQGWCVMMNLELSAGINGFVNVATLPADLKPNFNVPIFVAPNVSADATKIMTGYIGTDGKVNIRTPSATSGVIYATAMWAV